MPTLFDRFATTAILEATSDTPVIAINGPRQSGKSTLVAALELPGRVQRLTLDDDVVRHAASSDPRGFVERAVDCLVIDEVQLEPRLFRAMKAAVDRDRRPGRFVVTGSARLLAAPDMADALVGRVEVIELHPLSQGEIRGAPDRFIDLVFDAPDELLRSGSLARDDYVGLALAGGFPDVIRRSPHRRPFWFQNYIRTITQRVVTEMVDIDRAAEIPGLIALLASRSGYTLNVASLSREIGIPSRTLDGYLALLVNAFVFRPVPAWSTNLSAKVVRSPKIHLVDSGLAGHLIGLTGRTAPVLEAGVGGIVETFVVNELDRQLVWAQNRPSIWHFRDRGGSEVDIVLEHPDGRVVAVEVKAASTVGRSDLNGLTFLRDRLGSRFHRGIILSAAPEALPLGDRLLALPLSALWASGG